MNRYRAYGNLDDQPQTIGDNSFIGVDEYNAGENIKPGNVQKAVNHDFTSQDAVTRGGFVCLPELGVVPYGQVWTYNAVGGSPAFVDVSYGANLFVAVGSAGVIYSSPDAITWTSRTPPNTPNYTDIAYANGRFIAVGGATGSGPYPVAYSDDGITWSLPATPFSTSRQGISYGNGLWIAVASNAVSISSDNGLNWTTTTPVPELVVIFGLSFGNGIFCATGASGNIATTANGTTWSTVSIPLSGTIVDIVFGNQTFVALDSEGRIFTSTDTLTWTQQRDSDGDTWRTITFGNGRFVAFAGTSGGDNVIYSISGTQWIRLNDIPNYDWRGSTYGDGLFVAVGSSGATMNSASLGVYASAVYSDPNSIGQTWIMIVGYDSVGFYANGYTGKSISLGAYTVTVQSTIVQANNQVYIFRGADEKPLYWDGNWNGTFELVPDTTLPASFLSIPNSNQATFCQNRLWVIDGKDEVAASDVLEFTDYDPLANELHINTGGSDYLVATFPFGQDSLIAFKNKSILLIQNIQGALSDPITGVPIATVTEITRQVGLVGINGVTSIGPDLAYVSNQNINLLTLTSTNNSLQHKTLPLSTRIRTIMSRVNWKVGYKISIGYWSNKLYVALPVDNSLVCNAVVVYNFTTENWFGEWSFDSTLNMCIQSWQVIDYLGLQRMHAVTEDGRIFVTDEGQNDISGATVAEISTQLVTRAYDTSNVNHFQRRAFVDLATNRPEVSVSAFTEGASEESVILTDQTYSRSETWKFADSAYDLTNANNDFNRAYRKDYSTGSLGGNDPSPPSPGLPATGLQTGTGFQPQMVQEYRLPLITRRQGRLSWLEVTNTQGYISVMAVGYEARAGQRANLVQV
jgi:hypothetical protein